MNNAHGFFEEVTDYIDSLNDEEFYNLLVECGLKNCPRISPKNITSLEPNEIFVFGSNESGRHGRGAAKTAMQWGAKYGQAFGLQGRTFAIPTKNKDITEALSLEEIEDYVEEFYYFAKENDKYLFLVTEIGCGLAGYTPKEIAPLFFECSKLKNVALPESFLSVLYPEID